MVFTEQVDYHLNLSFKVSLNIFGQPFKSLSTNKRINLFVFIHILEEPTLEKFLLFGTRFAPCYLCDVPVNYLACQMTQAEAVPQTQTETHRQSEKRWNEGLTQTQTHRRATA